MTRSMMRSLPFLLSLILLISACRSEAPGEINPAAMYDAYGASISLDGVVPVQAILAEAKQFVGREVKMEGVASGPIHPGDCAFSIRIPEASVRVSLSGDDEATCLFDQPSSLDGLRVVVRGTLTQTPETPTDSGFHLTASGLLVQKTRHDS